MLGHEAGLLPSLPEIEYPERFSEEAGKAERRPEDLTASLPETPVDLSHGSMISQYLPRAPLDG